MTIGQPETKCPELAAEPGDPISDPDEVSRQLVMDPLPACLPVWPQPGKTELINDQQITIRQLVKFDTVQTAWIVAVP